MENLSISEDSSLSAREWELLTYIVRTYDVDTAVRLSDRSGSSQQKELMLNLPCFQAHHTRCVEILPVQSLLSSDQEILLTNLIQTYDRYNAIPIIERILIKQNSYQPKLRYKLKHTFFLIDKFFSSLQLFVDQLLCHTTLNAQCREQIQARNFHTIGCLNGLFIGRETRLLHHQAHATNFNTIYRDDLMTITNRLTSVLEENDVLLKLFLVVLLFSTHVSIVSEGNIEHTAYENYSQINHYQTTLIDLLWKYMLYKYDFAECISRFSTMIKIVLDLLSQLHATEGLYKNKQSL